MNKPISNPILGMINYYTKLFGCLALLLIGLWLVSRMMRYEGDTTVQLFEWSVTKREIALAITPGSRADTVDFEDPIRTYARVRKLIADLTLLCEHPDTKTFMHSYAPPGRSPFWVLLDPSFHFTFQESRGEQDFLNLIGELASGRHLASAQTFVALLNRGREKYTLKRVREDMPSMLRGAVDAVEMHEAGSSKLLSAINISTWCTKLEVALSWQDAPSLRASMLIITERLQRLAKFWLAVRGTHMESDLDREIDHLLNSVPDVDDVHFEVRMSFFMVLDTYLILDNIHKQIATF